MEMERLQMNKKKILWIALLVAFIVVIAIIVITVKPYDSNKNNSNSIAARSESSESSSQSEKKEVKVTKTELEDGTLYTFTDDEITPDVIITDNFFDSCSCAGILSPVFRLSVIYDFKSFSTFL